MAFLYPIGSNAADWNEGIDSYAAWLGTKGSSSTSGCWLITQFKNPENYAIKITSAYYRVTARSGAPSGSNIVKFLISDNPNDLDHYITGNYALSEKTQVSTSTVQIIGSAGDGVTFNNPQYNGKDILIDAGANFYVGFWQPAKSSIVTMRIENNVISTNNFRVNKVRPTTTVPRWSEMIQWNSSSGPNPGASWHIPRFRVAYEPALSKVEITDGSSAISAKSIEKGKTFDLDARVTGSAQSISWSSSNSSIASVNSNGTVTAKAYGTVKITVTAKSGDTTKTDTCTIYVYEFSPKASPSTIDTIEGSNTTSVTSGFRHPGNITLSWSSADSSTLSLSGSGNTERTGTGVRVLSPATSKSVNVTITIPSSSTYGMTRTSKSVSVTVRQSVTSFDLNITGGGGLGNDSDGFILYTGKKNDRNTVTLTVSNIQPSNAYSKTVSFTKSSGAYTVSGSGASGTLLADASISDSDGENEGLLIVSTGVFKKNINIFVRQSVTSISYTASNYILWTLLSENSADLNISILPGNAYHKTYTWNFVPAGLLVIDASNTKISVIPSLLPEKYTEGFADVTVTITSDDDSSENGNFSKVFSVRQYATGIKINENPAPTQYLYDKPITDVFTVTVFPENSYYKMKDVIWESSNTLYATVKSREPDGAGLLTSIYAGDNGLASIVLTASLPDSKNTFVSDSVIVQIRQKALQITLTPSNIACDSGETIGVTCIYYPANTSDKRTQWGSENALIMRPEQNTTNNVCGFLADEFGETRIYAKTMDGTNLIAYADVLVMVPGNVIVNGEPKKIKKVFYYDGATIFRGRKMFSYQNERIRRIQKK